MVGLAAAQQIKPCTLELGGKSPIIVLPDADIDKAVTDAHHVSAIAVAAPCAVPATPATSQWVGGTGPWPATLAAPDS